jgi:predicted RNase H-like HicB family nuclease
MQNYYKSKKRLSKHIKLKKIADNLADFILDNKEINHLNEYLNKFNHMHFNIVKSIIKQAGCELTIQRLKFEIEVNGKNWDVYYCIQNRFYIGRQDQLGVMSDGCNLEELKKMMKEVIQLALEKDKYGEKA